VQGCETGWIIHGHTHSLGALRHPAPSSGDPVTLNDCLELCEGLTGSLLAGACLAVDVEFIVDINNSSTVVCWLHTDLARLTRKYHNPAVMQYVIVRCPQQQGSTLLLQQQQQRRRRRHNITGNNNNNNNRQNKQQRRRTQER